MDPRLYLTLLNGLNLNFYLHTNHKLTCAPIWYHNPSLEILKTLKSLGYIFENIVYMPVGTKQDVIDWFKFECHKK